VKSRPSGLAARDNFNFTIATEPIPPLRDGEIAIETKFISLDPAMRGWMNEGKSYVAPLGLGDVMRAYAAGHVAASRHMGLRTGDAVVGLFGVLLRALVPS
jgi:NADPH-dependent curcumin reductase CurA